MIDECMLGLPQIRPTAVRGQFILTLLKIRPISREVNDQIFNIELLSSSSQIQILRGIGGHSLKLWPIQS